MHSSNTMNQKEIGGYFSLELRQGIEYHKDAIRLNNARAALQYTLRAKKYRKIYLPHYICGCVLQPILAEHVEYEYYFIDEHFAPIFDKEVQDNECFLYVNYFGINENNVHDVISKYKNVIIDSTQAFYCMPDSEIHKNGVDILYSARKFFGVADGGYLYTNTELTEPLKKDVSYNRMIHLLKRIDLSANDGYSNFIDSECTLVDAGIKEMSNLTQQILCGVDYIRCAEQRRVNYLYLDDNLKNLNLIPQIQLSNQVPMVYPFYCEDGENIRDLLIKNKIYVATYWNDVLEHVDADSLEAEFTKNLLAIPIDQRYGVEDMGRILSYLL